MPLLNTAPAKVGWGRLKLGEQGLGSICIIKIGGSCSPFHSLGAAPGLQKSWSDLKKKLCDFEQVIHLSELSLLCYKVASYLLMMFQVWLFCGRFPSWGQCLRMGKPQVTSMGLISLVSFVCVCHLKGWEEIVHERHFCWPLRLYFLVP